MLEISWPSLADDTCDDIDAVITWPFLVPQSPEPGLLVTSNHTENWAHFNPCCTALDPTRVGNRAKIQLKGPSFWFLVWFPHFFGCWAIELDTWSTWKSCRWCWARLCSIQHVINALWLTRRVSLNAPIMGLM